MSITGIGSSLNNYTIGQMMSRMKARDPSELAASSEVEEKPNLSELFAELDTDSSGILTSDEDPQSLLDKLSEMTGMSENLEAFLNTYDTDGVEGLSEDEVIAALEANRPQGPPPPPGGMGRPDETEMVDAADADGNGIIDEDEAEALVDIINNATGSTLTAADLIDEYAENSEGLTTTEAVAAMMAYRPDGSSSSSAKGTSFEQEYVGSLETDEDGFLTSESIDSIVSFINEATGSELTKEDFLEKYATDSDGDGDIDSDDGITVDGAVAGMEAYRPEGPPSQDNMSMTAMAIGTYETMSLMGSQNMGDIFSMMMEDPQESINRMI